MDYVFLPETGSEAEIVNRFINDFDTGESDFIRAARNEAANPFDVIAEMAFGFGWHQDLRISNFFAQYFPLSVAVNSLVLMDPAVNVLRSIVNGLREIEFAAEDVGVDLHVTSMEGYVDLEEKAVEAVKRAVTEKINQLN